MRKVLNLPQDAVRHYEHLMTLSAGHSALRELPRYATIDSWSVVFDAHYEMQIKICSSDCAYPLWCEAVLFKDGRQVACTDSESELSGEWILADGEDQFVVEVVPVTRYISLGRLNTLVDRYKGMVTLSKQESFDALKRMADIHSIELPSVRDGQWKVVYRNKTGVVYECSCCGHLDMGTSAFCVCGARMKD